MFKRIATTRVGENSCEHSMLCRVNPIRANASITESFLLFLQRINGFSKQKLQRLTIIWFSNSCPTQTKIITHQLCLFFCLITISVSSFCTYNDHSCLVFCLFLLHCLFVALLQTRSLFVNSDNWVVIKISHDESSQNCQR